jgi:biotin transporter BioY
MNQAHIHLFLNHVPVLGIIFGAILLAFAMHRKSKELQMVTFVIFIVAGLFTIPVYLSGEGAEELVEDYSGVSHDTIHDHEESAELIIWGIGALGVFALVGFWLLKKDSLQPAYLWLILLIAVVVSIALARTAYLGGEIRHLEISSTSEVGS